MKLNKLPLNVIGLNRVGLNQIGSPSRRADTSARPYIDPEVLASLVAVCICDGKSNDDPDRAVIKNLVDSDNPFIISNAAFKLNSGYGKYEVDFTSWAKYAGNFIIDNNKVSWSATSNIGLFVETLHLIVNENFKEDINSFKIYLESDTEVKYRYIDSNGISQDMLLNNGENTLPHSYVSVGANGTHIGFYALTRLGKTYTIKQLPLYEGALVTDGKDDLITSTKTVKEMLGGSNEITVVSMIHQIGLNSTHDKAFTNYIEATNATTKYVRSQSKTAGKTGIYGYTYNGATQLLINNILGDKNDYEKLLANAANILSESSIFRVASGSSSTDTLSQVAWYWTIIANKVLTTDQINQVISYFNLDKHVKPDIIYDTIRQGITNENHASFNDELTDFSGNGHNMKIYNSAWNKESGINDEGAWQADGVTDYGQYVGDLGLKDYTIAVDRAYVEAKPSQVSIMSNGVDGSTKTPFLMEHMGINKILAPHSFGKYTVLSELNINRFISYQSTYKYNGIDITKGTSTNTGSGLTIGRIGGVASQYANIALWSLLLFPYSLSEFLLERQLKRYKLGTLYPGMIEWRPKVNINVPVVTPPTFSMNNGSDIITNGQYIPEGTEITIRIFTTTDSSVGGINEATAKINGVDIELSPSGNKTYYGGKFIVSSKQKIDITIDEYIRYEDIVQPYPAIINLKQDGKTITWGDKLKVGSDIVFVGSANLLPELYTVSDTRYNGVTLYPNTIIKVEKSMVFDNARTYLKANEPSCILSPNRLRIPNSSYKILGYIPDLTGKGNRGRLNNFAYTEESGANEDGSIRFDGTDDHIIIPTIKHGGKALLMKVNWRYNNNIAMAYDQRINWGGLGISISPDQLPLVAYKPYNKVTYIDGIKNESVLVQDLEGITHNITGIYDNLDLSNERDVCISRTSDVSNSGFADMSMYEFMLFPDVPNEEEIKELNDIVGIENNIEVS